MIIDTNPKIDTAQQPNNNSSSDSEVVLSVQGVAKKFCRDLKRSLFYGVQDIAGDLTGLRTKSDRLRAKEFWALDDVTFQLRKGEALGLVGKNGSGKSTLLRIIAGLIKPDLGSVEVKGKVAPLIALGAGFNPILTGRENIYANMSILGLSKKEIDERFDDVVEFAEIGDAIDAPVQTYSSGMAARLGFASAIHTEPDILLIDEVLAVGDLKFRAKCHRKLNELRQKGVAFILVSHNPQSVLSVCNSAVYLIKGKLIVSDAPDVVMNRYEEDLFLGGVETYPGEIIFPKKPKHKSFGLDIIALSFRDIFGNIKDSLKSGEPAYLCIVCHAKNSIRDVIVRVIIREISGGDEVALTLSNHNDKQPFTMSSGENQIQIEMPYVGLKPGIYSMKIILRKAPIFTFDVVESYRFKVEGDGSMSNCIFYQPRAWKVLSKSQQEINKNPENP
ncbi:ABC transporter ATP-binding protein [Pleurocapsa sp. PCC 7319]|uniref:ABC transporter ATP-binding protein n=1 Tax=Pleurocapsa sp. PCC 7319 TaxID=118161 RepID=UPI000345029D|nr:ABC transporter ATP-binding protein [Pleurocapsa sp. PCC 7319]